MNDLENLRDRLMRATTTVDGLALRATSPNEKRRLQGKSDGIRLALSYVQETLNALTPRKDSQ